jgi:opacity protein-like surface antigen
MEYRLRRIPGPSAAREAYRGGIAVSQSIRRHTHPALTLAVTAALAAPTAQAQTTEAPAGIPADGFLWRTQASLTSMYDTNIYATRANEIADTVWLFTPTLSGESQWRRHRVRVNAGADLGRYGEYASENFDDYWADVEGRYDLGPGSNLFGGLGYSREHEERGSPDSPAGGVGAALVEDEPTVYDAYSAHAGVTDQTAEGNLRFGGTFERLVFRDDEFVENSDRDRDLYGLGVRYGHRLDAAREVFVQALWDGRYYDQTRDDFGYTRNSDGYRLGIGLKQKLGPGLDAEGFVGYLRQDYDDDRFDTVSTADFGAKLNWQATPGTKVRLSIDRSLNETTLAGSSSYLYTRLDGSVSHDLDSDTTLNASLGVGLAEYQDVGRDDWLYSAGFNLRHMLSRQVYVTAGYRIANRDSNVAEGELPSAFDPYDYGRQQLYLTLGVLAYPEPRSDADTPTGAPAATALPGSGGYVGGQVGYGVLGTDIRPDEAPGAAASNHGGDGWEGGLFAGYGLGLGRWYIGAELEADTAAERWGADWVRPATGLNRGESFGVERESGYAASALLGYALPGSHLLYGRLGYATADFEAEYTATGGRDVSRVSSTESGVRLGAGAELPLRDGWFVRFDYAYTDYGDFAVDYLRQPGSGSRLRPAVDTYDLADAVFRVGIGIRFGGRSERAEAEAETAPLAGFYAGAALGQLALHGNVAGTVSERNTAEGAAFPVAADYADYGGMGGVFAGWGIERNRWYLGIEVEAEGAEADWRQPRESEGGQRERGRGFSVARKEGYGIGARLGYQLANGALLYARGGVMQSRFATSWLKGQEVDTAVVRDDRLVGTRFGAGAELPATDRLFVRLDYTRTDYGDVSFTTTQRFADDVSIDSAENVFRLGLGYRF